MKYLIIEQGVYSDYGMFFVEKDDRLTNEEHLELLNIDETYNKAGIAGEIEGEFLLDNNIRIDKIEEVAKNNLNRLFCCYYNRKYITVLDKEYSKEELLKIARENDNSPDEYWNREIDIKYQEYKRGFELYLKIK